MLQAMGLQRVGRDLATKQHFFFFSFPQQMQFYLDIGDLKQIFKGKFFERLLFSLSGNNYKNK